jgi:hypothetical protein
MSDKTEYSRLLIKRATETGVVPTIPTGTTLSTFTNTDLFVGELFLNTTDENLWVRTDNGILQILNSGFTSSIFATGFTYDNANTLTISNNNGSTLQTSINTMTGLTVNGAFSATTLFGDGSGLTGINSGDIFVTGFTYDNANKLTIVSNSGASLNTFINVMTGLTINGELIFDSTGGILLDNSSRLREGTIDAGTGGNNGIAQICGLGYELKWEAGSLYVMGSSGNIIREVRYTFTNTPTVNDDVTKGFTTGSRWVLDDGDIYVCSDPSTGAAVWDLLITDNYVTGGTFTANTLTLDRQNGSVTITGFTDTIFSGGSGNCITDLYVSNIIGCSPLSIFSDTSITGFTTGGSYTAKDVNSGGANLKRTINKSSTGEISVLEQQLDRLKFDVDYNNGNLYTSTQMIDYIEFNTLNDTSKYQGVIKYVEGVGIELSETKTDTGEYYRLTLDKIGNEIISDDNSGTTANFVNNIVGNTLTATDIGYTSTIDQTSSDITTTLIGTGYPITTINSLQTASIGSSVTFDDGVDLYGTSQSLSSQVIQFKFDDTINSFSSRFDIDPLQLGIGSGLRESNSAGELFTYSYTPIQSNQNLYDPTILSNVTSISLLNTSTDGTATITAIGNTSVLSQDTLSLDPLNGSYLRSQSTTSIPYTELALNDNDIAIEAYDGVNSRSITLVSTGITVTGGVIKYDGDYSSQYTNRSIVDKEYVDSVVGGGSTFTGGTVTGATNFTAPLSAKTLTLDTTYTGTTGVGTISWNTDFGVPQVGMIGGNVVGKIGESVYAYVKNVDTTTLNKGEVVYIFGASGDKISVKRASSSGDTTSSKTLGVVAESISVNGLGYVITQGTLDGLNLGAYTAGDILWLGNTPGTFTKVKTYAPNHLVFVGVVQRANAGNGQMYVKPQNGYELEELHNVATTGATNGDLLVYSGGSTNLWVNSKTLTGTYTVNGGLNVTGTTTSGIVSATTISATTYNGDGKNLLGVGGGKGSFGITIDGGGSAITTGVKGYITVPYNGTITGWDIFGDTTGSIVVDVWKDTYANFPPTVADTIAGTEKPTLSSAVKNQDTNLTSWTTSVTAGDIVAFNVDSATTVTRVNLIIYITKQ